MRNLILTIVILVTGIINAQSFEKVKELKWVGDRQLIHLGFEKQVEKDSIYFKLWNFNEAADAWINPTTKEVVKTSRYATEYIHNDSVMIQKRTWPSIYSVNISYALLHSAGYEISPFFKWIGSLKEEDMEVSTAASIYKNFKTFYLLRVLKTDDLCNNSFVVFY